MIFSFPVFRELFNSKPPVSKVPDLLETYKDGVRDGMQWQRTRVCNALKMRLEKLEESYCNDPRLTTKAAMDEISDAYTAFESLSCDRLDRLLENHGKDGLAQLLENCS